MRRLVILTFIILIMAACAEKRPVTEEEIIEKICTVTLLEGEVVRFVEGGSEELSIAAGDNLNESDTVKTGPASTLELQLGDSSLIRIKENSELKILKLYQDVGEQSTQLFLNSGKLLANPEEQTEGSSFEVQTQTITLGVRGTEFVMISDEEGTKVAVKSGKVAIKSRMDIEALEKIKEIDPELAQVIEETVNREVTVGADEKLEVAGKELEAAAEQISLKVEEIVAVLEEGKESGRLEEVVEELEAEVEAVVETISKPEEISSEESAEEFGLEEFVELSQKRLELKEDLRKLKEEIEQKREELEKLKEEEHKRDEVKSEKLEKELGKRFEEAEALIKKGEYDSALSLAATNLERAKSESGERTILTAIALQQLAWAYRAKEESLQSALQYIEESISIYEELSSKQNILLARAYSQHGELFYLIDDFRRSEEVFLKLLDYLEREDWPAGNLAEADELRAQVLKGLAGLALGDGRNEAALDYTERALTLAERLHGKESPELISLLDSYKGLLKGGGREEEALQVEERITAIMESSPQHKEKIEQMRAEEERNKLYQEFEMIFKRIHRISGRGDAAGAVKLAEETLNRAKEEFGEDSFMTGRAMHELAGIFIMQNRFAEAESLLAGALPIYTEELGSDSVLAAYLYLHRGFLHFRKGDMKEAQRESANSLAMAERLIKERDKGWREALKVKTESLKLEANIFLADENYGEAERGFKMALKLAEEEVGADKGLLIEILKDYKRLYEARGQKSEVEKINGRLVMLMEGEPRFQAELEQIRQGGDDRESRERYEKLFRQAVKLRERGQKNEALRMAERTLERAKEELGEDSLVTARAMQELSHFYMDDDSRPLEVERLVKGAIAIYEERGVGDDPSLFFLYGQLGEFYLRRGRLEESGEVLSNALNRIDYRIKEGVGNKRDFTRARAELLIRQAELAFKEKRHDDAEKGYKEAITELERSGEGEGPQMLHLLNRYKELLVKMGKDREIGPLEEKIFRLQESSPEHKEEVRRRKDEERERKLWDKFDRRFDDMHRAVERNRMAEAIRIAEETVEMAESDAGKNHEITAIAMMNLADLYIKRPGRMADAEYLLEEALKIVKGKDFGPDGGPLGQMHLLYGEVMLDRGDLKKAERSFKQAAEISDRALSRNAGDREHQIWIRGQAAKGLGDIYFADEKYVQSELQYREALNQIERIVSADSEELLFILEPYLELLESQNKRLEARRIEERIERIRDR